MALRMLTKGNAATAPPKAGLLLAVSVTVPIMMAEMMIFTTETSFRPFTEQRKCLLDRFQIGSGEMVQEPLQFFFGEHRMAVKRCFSFLRENDDHFPFVGTAP